MGIDDVTVSETSDSIGGSEVFVYGNNFTKWSKVFVNDEKVNTTFSNSGCLIIPKDSVKDGDTIKVCQMGSNSTIFRESNTYTYKDPAVEETVTGNRVGQQYRIYSFRKPEISKKDLPVIYSLTGLFLS